MQRIKERQLATFVPWSPAEFNLTLGHNSSHVGNSSRVNGLLLANHTSVSGVHFPLNPDCSSLILPCSSLKRPVNSMIAFESGTRSWTNIAENHCSAIILTSSTRPGIFIVGLFLISINSEEVQSVVDEYQLMEDPNYPLLNGSGH